MASNGRGRLIQSRSLSVHSLRQDIRAEPAQALKRAMRRWFLGFDGTAPFVWRLKGQMVFNSTGNRDAYFTNGYRAFRVSRHVFLDRVQAIDQELDPEVGVPVPLPPTIRFDVAFLVEADTIGFLDGIVSSPPTGLVSAFLARHKCRMNFEGDPATPPSPPVYFSFP